MTQRQKQMYITLRSYHNLLIFAAQSELEWSELQCEHSYDYISLFYYISVSLVSKSTKLITHFIFYT